MNAEDRKVIVDAKEAIDRVYKSLEPLKDKLDQRADDSANGLNDADQQFYDAVDSALCDLASASDNLSNAE